MPSSPENTPKRQRKCADERREDILCAAVKVFAEQGFRCADVQQIADLAGIGKGTVYRFFATKEELFKAAVDDAMRSLTSQVDGAAEGVEDPLQRLRLGFKAYMAFFQACPEIIELFVHERAELRGTAKPLYFVYSEERRGAWLAVAQRLIDSGRTRISDPELLLDAIGHLSYGAVLVNRISGRNQPLDEAADDFLDVLFNGICKSS
ncbi:TetR/AcrR family transcriptional regulator [Pseudomonas sp.]|jgi:AcrR family transcriptional regulator|uniref:TetR/AcrR family transcriptional regulator n=1 Tax=Pseudomonas sp. TaxID=306 RepID=UPI00272D8B96|nr:TetR/AcrR family transcriptional regulator [Pseudomonas sp.]